VRTVATSGEGTSGDPTLVAGMEVGEYRVEELLGKGGFGTVYRGVHPLIGKLVAIKVLARRYSADPDVVSRFVAEAKAVNQIRHRNIIDIFSFGALPDGRHYYVMEYLDGETLDAYLRAHGAMPLHAALPILKSIARALDAAHAKGIAHRDLKPENVFLAIDSDGTRFPKLLDFGIAKLLTPDDDVLHKTGTGVPIGTPYYMSPEQARGRAVDHRTDVYSFGILAYRTLTMTYPFEGDDYMELLLKQMKEEPPAPSSRNSALPAAVDAAIAWMMQKDPSKRPSLVIDGVAALDDGAATTPHAPSAEPSPPPPPAPPTTSSVDALAATSAQVTPLAPSRSAATPVTGTPDAKRSRAAMWIGGSVVLVATALVAVFAIGHDRGDGDGGGSGSVAVRDMPGSAGSDQLDQLHAGSAHGIAVGSDPVSKPHDTDVAGRPHGPPPQTMGGTTAPKLVTIAIRGVPNHTHVRVDGVAIDRELPGTIELPHGQAAVELVFDGPGGFHVARKVVPDGSVTELKLERQKPNVLQPNAQRPTQLQPEHDSHAIPNSEEIFHHGGTP
jgi:serine/threonine-protein kinase